MQLLTSAGTRRCLWQAMACMRRKGSGAPGGRQAAPGEKRYVVGIPKFPRSLRTKIPELKSRATLNVKGHGPIEGPRGGEKGECAFLYLLFPRPATRSLSKTKRSRSS
jgi:hypothetical protein